MTTPPFLMNEDDPFRRTATDATRETWAAAVEEFAAGLTCELVRTVEQRGDVFSERVRAEQGFGPVGTKVMWGIRFMHNGIDLSERFRDEYALEGAVETEWHDPSSKKATAAHAAVAPAKVIDYLLGRGHRNRNGGYPWYDTLNATGNSLGKYIWGQR